MGARKPLLRAAYLPPAELALPLPSGRPRRVTPYAFAALLAALFLGPQDRAHNMGLNMVWAMW